MENSSKARERGKCAGGSKYLVNLLPVLLISLENSVRTYHSSPELKYVTEMGIQHLSEIAGDWYITLRNSGSDL